MMHIDVSSKQYLKRHAQTALNLDFRMVKNIAIAAEGGS